MLKKIDHIGIAVHSIAKARLFYEDILGLSCQAVEEVESQKVQVAFFEIGEITIELLEPKSESGPIAKFLQKHGQGIHHIAYLSDNLEKQLATAQKKGCKLINKAPIRGAHGKDIAFIHPSASAGVLTEICAQRADRKL